MLWEIEHQRDDLRVLFVTPVFELNKFLVEILRSSAVDRL